MQGGGRRCYYRQRIWGLNKRVSATNPAGKSIRSTSRPGNHRRRFWATCRVGPEAQSVWSPCACPCLWSTHPASRLWFWTTSGISIWAAGHVGRVHCFWRVYPADKRVWPDGHSRREAKSVWSAGTNLCARFWTVGIRTASSTRGQAQPLRSANRGRRRFRFRPTICSDEQSVWPASTATTANPKRTSPIWPTRE